MEKKKGKIEESQIDDDKKFERLKYWVDLGKWFIVSVAMVLISQVVSWNFTSRDKSFEEVKFYSEKYVTELFIANDKVAPKYRLAQFFKNVTVNNEQREGWERYYVELSKEMDSKIKEEKKLVAERSQILNKGKESYSDEDSIQLNKLNNKIEAIGKELNSKIRLPDLEQNTEDFSVGIHSLNPDDSIHAFIIEYLHKSGYKIFADISHSGKKPSWMAYENTVLYYSSKNKNTALNIALALKEKTGLDFSIQRGAGLGVRSGEELSTFFVHYVN